MPAPLLLDRPATRQKQLLLLLGAASLCAAVGWIFFLLAYRQTHDIAAGGLFPGGATYLDLTTYITRFDVFRTRAFFQEAVPPLQRSRFAYPPAAALCYEFLYRSHHMKFVYNLLSVAVWGALLGAFGMALWRSTKRPSLSLLIPASAVLLSYPAMFLFERANIEILLWVLLAAGPLLYLKNMRQAAAVCFGVAAAMKLYPILLLGLFVGRRRDWSALVTGLVTSVLVTAGTIAFTAPGFFRLGAQGYLQGITGFQTKYAGTLDAGPNAFDHSLFSWVKQIALHSGHNPTQFTRAYYLACGVAAGAALLIWVRKRPFVNQLTFLMVCMVLLPPVSFEYTLVHLYLLTGLLCLAFVCSGAARGAGLGAMIALGCLLALLLPVNVLGPLASFAGQVQVLPLLALVVAAVAQPWIINGPAASSTSPAPAPKRGEAALA